MNKRYLTTCDICYRYYGLGGRVIRVINPNCKTHKYLARTRNAKRKNWL